MRIAYLGRMRKKTALTLLLLITPFFAAPSGAKERKHGFELLIQKKDGMGIRGELLRVKGSQLLIMENLMSSGVTLDIGEISRIQVVKKSKFFEGLGMGFFGGVAIGIALGFAQEDDEPGFMSFSGGGTALILGLTGGILGGSVGGILGSLVGIDESIDLEGRSNDEIRLVLNKLNSRSRFPAALPDKLKVGSSDLQKSPPKPVDRISPVQNPISLDVGSTSKSKKQTRRFSRFHLSLEPGIFKSQGSPSLIKAFRGWGFGDSKHDWEFTGWFVSGDYVSICTQYPEGGTGRSSVLKNIKLEFSLNQKIALGLSYSPLPKSCVNGFKCLETYMDDWTGFRVDNGLDLHGEFKGSVYYFSVAFMPVPDAYLQKSSIKIGAGLGLSNIHYVVSSGEEKKSDSKNSPSLMTFAEYHYWFSRDLTLGSYLDYQYIPCRVGFQLDPGWEGQRMLLNFPKKNVDFGGFGFGLVLGLHL